ncbi:MOSC domain-containing protein [Phaeobacter italicus]|uniref:MOSC domain-containing protein n=1 Tax=Phaeobacter italicus TaxID=481446 RepID=UPI0035126DA7
MTATVKEMWRHPIKGIGAEPLSEVRLETGGPMPFDRAWAVLTGTSQDTGAWQHCRNFARGCFGPELMAITARTDLAQDGAAQITLSHPRQPDLSLTLGADIAAESDRLIAWLSPLYPGERPQPHSLIKAPEGGMADASFSAVAILSLSSLRALGDVLGQDLDPRRFRGNIWIDDTAAFGEFDWVGQQLQIGETRLEVVDRITRCRATETNPDTGVRDAETLKALRDTWGHTDFGIRAKVLDAGQIRIGDKLELL